MKIYINSLTYDYDSYETINNDNVSERICTSTRIEAEVNYPATETNNSVTFRGCVKYNGKLCDMNEAKKIVEKIVKQNKN